MANETMSISRPNMSRQLKGEAVGMRRHRLPASSRAFVAIAIVAVLCSAYCQVFSARLSAVEGDGQGYYAYLPAVVLGHDPSFRTLLAGQPSNQGGSLSAVLQHEPSGAYLDKYSYGVALIAAPFFIVGHATALVAGQAATGYSPLEEDFTALAAVAAGLAGLLALRALLRRRFRDGVVAITLVAAALGSGLLHWMAYDPLYSHAFSFGAIAVFILCALRLRERPDSWRRALECGFAAGVVILIRIPNVVVVLPFALLGVTDGASLRRRISAVCRHRTRLTAMAACAILPLLPQLILWKQAMGRWLASPYVGESFHWANPQFQALYAFRPHGLLPYAPVLALAVIGLPVLYRNHREWWWPVILATLIDTYLLCTWHDTFLGVGFGQRGFVDLVPALALPFAALISAARRTLWRPILIGATAVLTATTMLAMLVYWEGRLPHYGATVTTYISVLTGGAPPGGIDAN